MIGDILGSVIAGAIGERLGHSRRAQWLVRLTFGLIGGALGLAGAASVAFDDRWGENLHLRACAVAVFGFLAAFCLFNVALARTWRWPGRLFVLSLGALFVVRILLGP